MSTAAPRIGLAYAAYVPGLLKSGRARVDYIEIPFERLRSDKKASRLVGEVPCIMHCASLSLAGVVSAQPALVAEVRSWATQMRTPWVGEHLAFITAEADAGLLQVGYTVAPPLNESTLRRVIDAVTRYEAVLGTPIIVENPPQYFATPGSSMDQCDFLHALSEHSKIDLLLDLTHLLITACNLGRDPFAMLDALPLERVREIHLSGMREEAGVAWDDHGVTAPAETWALLARALERAHPLAITLEYNWPGGFDERTVALDVERARRLADHAVERR